MMLRTFGNDIGIGEQKGGNVLPTGWKSVAMPAC